MRVRSHLVIALMSLVALGACESIDAPEEAVGEQALALDEPEILPVRPEYFTAIKDRRVCFAPGCGGWLIAAVNQGLTRCVDGTYQPRCHVAHLDLSPLGLTDEEQAAFQAEIDHGLTVLKATVIGPELDVPFGEMIVEEGYHAQDRGVPSGTFFRIRDTREVCFAFPCFNLEVSTLNRFAKQRVSRIDWQTLSAPTDEALEQLRGDGILATGTIDGPVAPSPLIPPRGRAVHVTHHYTQVTTAARPAP